MIAGNATETTEGNGPKVERSAKQTRFFSKRAIFAFLALLAVIFFAVVMQADFTRGGGSVNVLEKNYRAPQASGFQELAVAMRSDRRPAKTTAPAAVPKGRTQRIVIEGTRETPPARTASALPQYYSNNADAQAANTLRTLKMQALAAKPVVEDFKTDSNEGAGSNAQARSDTTIEQTPQIMDSEAMAALMRQQGQAPDPNRQAGKQNFLRGTSGGGSMTPQGYSDSLPEPQRFPYELKTGTVIPGILISGINSDLPGNVLAQVSENVWDTATGKFVLIPKGTRIIGVYDSQVSFGQRRVMLVWNRLIFPNGTTLNIAGSPGVDQAGYSGLSGKVNEHWGTMLKSALLASVFVAGAEIVYDSDSGGNSDNKSPRDVAAENAAGSIIDMGTKLMNRAADVQPTITIRPGKKMGIFVQKDVVFPFPYF
ncbi:MAG: TrbI/VirB10 family protein [Synergistaceae bacterium]|jgi:type IV secretion system protein VirB10|nr:TrbI/VirB10 family protein [Synergistaceae bacterium]